jgi:hypothetical protein
MGKDMYIRIPAVRTSGGSSAVVASKSQMTPSRKEITLVGCKNERSTTIQEALAPHLFPKQASQAKRTSTMMAQAKQTKEHGDQQDEVGNKHGDEGLLIGPDIGWAAVAVCRNPRRADL